VSPAFNWHLDENEKQGPFKGSKEPKGKSERRKRGSLLASPKPERQTALSLRGRVNQWGARGGKGNEKRISCISVELTRKKSAKEKNGQLPIKK